MHVFDEGIEHRVCKPECICFMRVLNIGFVSQNACVLMRVLVIGFVSQIAWVLNIGFVSQIACLTNPMINTHAI
jgi:maltodextrin utilization protein YvdJ